MTWKRVNPGRAENDQGAQVTRTGYKSLKYEQGGREIVIDVEEGDTDLGVYARSIKHWRPFGETVTSEERAAIIEDIKNALRTLDVPFAILWN